MNTGVQRSGSTPHLGWTTTTPNIGKRKGKKVPSKSVPLIMAAHGIPYVATGTIAYPEDLLKKLKRPWPSKTACPTSIFESLYSGLGYAIPSSLEVCWAAVETNHFPLWGGSEGRVQADARGRPTKTDFGIYAAVTKFAHLREEDLGDFQMVDKRSPHQGADPAVKAGASCQGPGSKNAPITNPRNSHQPCWN
jgi:pyruvate/2-oxoacid:ferredoxin oxidoreductase beta subunit